MHLNVTIYINGLSCYCLKTIKTDKTPFFSFLLFYSVVSMKISRQVSPCGKKWKCVFYIALIARTVKVHANCSLKEKCNALLISI
jgi:hypothetical protein